MYNEKFAKEFPNMELILPVVDQLKKAGIGKHAVVVVEEKHYDAMLNQCEVVEENGAVGNVLNMTLVDISKQYELEERLDRNETVIGCCFWIIMRMLWIPSRRTDSPCFPQSWTES